MLSGPRSRSAGRSCGVVALLAACALVAVLCQVVTTQTQQKAVLVLIALQRGSPISLDMDGTIRTVLNDGLAGRLDYYTEYLDVARFPEPDYQPAVRDFFRRKYAGQTFDVVAATSDAMIDFVNTYRDELFPGAAVVFAAGSPRPGPKATGVVFPLDLKSTIDVAIQLHPDLRQVFVVSGESDSDHVYRDLSRAQFRAFDSRLGFTYSSGLAMPDLLRRVSALPRHTIVYFLSFFEDGHGNRFDELAALDRVAAAANVPTYAWVDSRAGHGSVGGTVLNVEAASAALANLALRVLQGESPESIPVREINPTTTQFDWRQLRRWGISETRLPAGSIVRFREPSLWDQYKLYIIGAAGVLVSQTGLIIGLLVQRVRRRRVEASLRESEQRFRVTAEENQNLAGRLINAQEMERMRIARDLHDDVSQQVASMGMMLSRLKRKLPEPYLEPDVGQAVATLQDRASSLAETIRNLSHELHPSVLQHTGLVATLRRHCAEVGADHVKVMFSDVNDIDGLSPDVALCLFRVAQEALGNAVRHSRAQTINVSLSATNEAVELGVIDDGIGFAASESQGSGLGLRSMNERVRLAGGDVRVESLPGQGTKVLVRIPQPQAPVPLEAVHASPHQLQ